MVRSAGNPIVEISTKPFNMVDGAGKRYFLGPLYMAMEDLEGALASYEWFDETFPDDTGDCGQYLCWTLALYRARRKQDAEAKLRQTMLMNRYVLPHLFGEEFEAPDSINLTTIEVAV